VWWESLTAEEQEDIKASVILLQRFWPMLRYPHRSSIASSRHSHMRKLRVQHAGRPYRLLHAFDSLHTAILLIGGDKTGNDRWYEIYVPIADRLYDEHVQQLKHQWEIPDG
jgi:hypothetical protein